MLFQVDAFTDKPFSGNPAAVYVSEQPLKSDWMQKIALEMNLSETAFTWMEEEVRIIRFFTPTQEVSLCGHATLATAHILWEEGITSKKEIVLKALETDVRVTKNDNTISFGFPKVASNLTDQNLDEIIGVSSVGNYTTENNWHVAILDSESDVIQANVDLSSLERTGKSLILLAKGEVINYVLRVFVPSHGIPEDPVTGYAQTITAPLWNKLHGGSVFVSRQVSKRGGRVEAELKEDQVIISGEAVSVFKIKIGLGITAEGSI